MQAVLDCAADELGVVGALGRLREKIARHRAWIERELWTRRRDWEIYRLKIATLRA